MTVLHLFDQPLAITRPYEGYMETLFLPQEVSERAAEESILLTFRTPRKESDAGHPVDLPRHHPRPRSCLDPGRKEPSGPYRALWKEWTDLGVHVVEDGFVLPTGIPAFNESGTYAPTFSVGTYEQGGTPSLPL